MGHHAGGEKVVGFGIVLEGAADQELDAGVLIAADQAGCLGDGVSEAVVVGGTDRRSRLAAAASSQASRKPMMLVRSTVA